jgi:prepilin-type N-terminal cleavage/methylation domain-containing protein
MNFLKTKLDNMKAKMGNEKGLTMMELMFVLLIIAIIIAVIVGVGGRGTDKARETGVKSDFKAFSDASEMYLVQEAGIGIDRLGLNDEIDAQFAVDDTTGDSVKVDPWKVAYNVTVTPIDTAATEAASIVVKSTGKTGGDDFTAAVYYYDGKSARCTNSLAGDADDAVNTVNSVFPTATFDIATDCGSTLVVTP